MYNLSCIEFYRVIYCDSKFSIQNLFARIFLQTKSHREHHYGVTIRYRGPRWMYPYLMNIPWINRNLFSDSWWPQAEALHWVSVHVLPAVSLIGKDLLYGDCFSIFLVFLSCTYWTEIVEALNCYESIIRSSESY